MKFDYYDETGANVMWDLLGIYLLTVRQVVQANDFEFHAVPQKVLYIWATEHATLSFLFLLSLWLGVNGCDLDNADVMESRYS